MEMFPSAGFSDVFRFCRILDVMETQLASSLPSAPLAAPPSCAQTSVTQLTNLMFGRLECNIPPALLLLHNNWEGDTKRRRNLSAAEFGDRSENVTGESMKSQ